MIDKTQLSSNMLEDIRRISQISIIPGMLESVCKSTGMGFAAIARVTDTQWIACSVRDEINFGLKPGGQLELETTICHEIRQSRREVVIGSVADDPHYCNHHTPAQYGFQSYISVPIITRSGDFFGTLCAIDPKPRILDEARAMFKLYAELIAFHIDSLQIIERSREAVELLSAKFEQISEENTRYQFITNHHLQEPLRKLQFYTDRLVRSSEEEIGVNAKTLAPRINALASNLSSMIKDVSTFSTLATEELTMALTDLNQVIRKSMEIHQRAIEEYSVNVVVGTLPHVQGDEKMLSIVFGHILRNAILYAAESNSARTLTIASTVQVSKGESIGSKVTRNALISFEATMPGIEFSELHQIFSLLNVRASRIHGNVSDSSMAYVYKIVALHQGKIEVLKSAGHCVVFLLTLPLDD